MPENPTPFCPECEDGLNPAVDRRNFIRVVGGTTAALALGSSLSLPGRARAADAPRTEKKENKTNKAAEELVKELFADLKDEQKKFAVMEYDHKSEKSKYLTRHRIFNAPIGAKIGTAYSKPQQELVEKILRSVTAGTEEAWKCISRAEKNKSWDNSGSFDACGAYIFGDPNTKKWAWVFTGHHLTVRCDGDCEEGPAFGGPIYYGHTPNPYSDRNCFYYQTKEVIGLLDALDAKQRKQAIIPKGDPGELEPSITLKKDDHPGLAFGELTKDQKALTEKVMRSVLLPYRKEDVDEVMQVIKTNGGMDKIHLAFYPDKAMKDDEPWHFWRLEGPGFVWNFRVLPHVHTYVNISTKMGEVT